LAYACTENPSQAYEPPKKRSGIPPPPSPRDDAEDEFAAAPIKISADYRVNAEYHNPMEMFGTTCVFEAPGKLTIYEKTQGSQNTQGYVASVFGLRSDDVRVVNHYVGGAFGSGLRPQPQLFLAVMASLALERSVRVSLDRSQMSTSAIGPTTIKPYRSPRTGTGGCRPSCMTPSLPLHDTRTTRKSS